MHLDLTPFRYVIAGLFQGQQKRLLMFFKNYTGHLPCRPVDSCSCRRLTPFDGLSLCVSAVDKLFPFEEVLPHIGYLPLHGCFALRMPHNRRINDESLVLRILQESPIEYGLISVRLHDGSLHVIDNQAPGGTAKEPPCLFDSTYKRRQVLLVCYMHVLMPAEDKRNHEGIQYASY